MNEQELFGLMAIAQEQQQAVGVALKKLAARQVELDAVVSRASKAAESIEQASQSAADIIQKAARSAALQGVRETLEPIGEQTRVTLAKAIDPATAALNQVTRLVIDTDKQLHATKNALTWKFTAILGLLGCMMLATIVGLAHLFVPSLQEIADLKATVADLERRGGRIQLTNCGEDHRLCAKVNLKAKANESYGKDGEWMILQGY